MDFSLFKDFIMHISQNKYPKNISFDFGGEPFLNPRLIEMVDFAARNGKSTYVTTNGTLLTENLIESILKSRLPQLNISIDIVNGANIREGYPLEKITESVNRLITERNKLKRHSPKVIIRCINFKGTPRKNILKLFKAEPNGIIFCPVTNWSGLIGESLPDKKQHICFLPWLEMAMLYNGDFALCCNDPRGDLIIGSFPKNSLEEIWNGQKLIKLRELISRKKEIFLQGQNCRQCSRMRTGISFKEHFDYYRGKIHSYL